MATALIAVFMVIGGVFLWKFLKVNIPYWKFRVEEEASEESEDSVPRMRFDVPERKSERKYTVSKNGETKEYSSVDTMPPEERERFLEAEKLIEDARRRMKDAFKDPFFSKSYPGNFRSSTTTTTTTVKSTRQTNGTSNPKPKKYLN